MGVPNANSSSCPLLLPGPYLFSTNKMPPACPFLTLSGALIISHAEEQCSPYCCSWYDNTSHSRAAYISCRERLERYASVFFDHGAYTHREKDH